tara:strand:- start:5204 stop:5557 length:354 start_codon:yes stop_codon:yes gene_type:complete
MSNIDIQPVFSNKSSTKGLVRAGYNLRDLIGDDKLLDEYANLTIPIGLMVLNPKQKTPSSDKIIRKTDDLIDSSLFDKLKREIVVSNKKNHGKGSGKITKKRRKSTGARKTKKEREE